MSATIKWHLAQMVKNLPAMQEARVRFLGQEDPLEKGTAIHSSIGARRIPRKEAWRATVRGVAKNRTPLNETRNRKTF